MGGEAQHPRDRSGEGLVQLVTDLVTSSEALSALSAALWVHRSGARPTPAVERSLAEVLAALGLDDLLDLASEDLAELSDLISARLMQACELRLDPLRTPGWRPAHPEIISTATVSAETLALFLADSVVPRLPGLAARLESADAALLDVGAGACGLLVCLCRIWPMMTATGIDILEPVLELGRERVVAAGLDARVELRNQDVADLDDRDAYDLVCLPAGFIAPELLPVAVRRVLRATKPGGWLIVSAHAGTDALSIALARLRTARDGGTLLTPPETTALLLESGWVSVRQLSGEELPTLSLTLARKGPESAIAK